MRTRGASIIWAFEAGESASASAAGGARAWCGIGYIHTHLDGKHVGVGR